MATDHLGRRFIIGFLIFLPLWTFTKVPFYLAFKRDGPTANEKMGLEQHINMEYWIPVSTMRCDGNPIVITMNSSSCLNLMLGHFIASDLFFTRAFMVPSFVLRPLTFC